MSTDADIPVPDDTPVPDAPDAGQAGDDVSDADVSAPTPETGTDSTDPPATDADPVRRDSCEAAGGQ